MELRGSLPCSQGPSTGPYSESDESRPYHSNMYYYANAVCFSNGNQDKVSNIFSLGPLQICRQASTSKIKPTIRAFLVLL
jgi:hypothetical protein